MQLEWTSDASVCPALLFLLANLSIPCSSHRARHSRCAINHLPVHRSGHMSQAWPILVPHLPVHCSLSQHIAKQVQADIPEIWCVDAAREKVSFFWIINCKDTGIKLPGFSRKKIKPTCKEDQRSELVRESPDSTVWAPQIQLDPWLDQFYKPMYAYVEMGFCHMQPMYLGLSTLLTNLVC